MSGAANVGVYECSGIRISSEIPLPVPLLGEADPATADLMVELGEPRTPPFDRPSDDVVAELFVDGFPRYSICRVAGKYVVRIVNVGDFVVDPDLRRVVCHPVVAGPTDVLPMIIAGTIAAFHLAMSGRCALHGSAVEVNGRALAFVGGSGQGKSTMAAVFCASGARLVADDVLPLELGADGAEPIYCLPSSVEIRLRERAASLVNRFDGNPSVRLTADHRRAVEPIATALDRVPLAGVVLPRPDRDHAEVSARALAPGEASLWLGRCQRIEGWRDSDRLRKQFVDVGRIVASVPVFEVLVPWGPPFPDDLHERVIGACGLTGLLAEPG